MMKLRRRLRLQRLFFGVMAMFFTVLTYLSAGAAHRVTSIAKSPDAWVIGLPMAGALRLADIEHPHAAAEESSSINTCNRGPFRLRCWRRVGSDSIGFDESAGISRAIVVVEQPLATLSRLLVDDETIVQLCRRLDGEATQFPCTVWMEDIIEWYNRALEVPQSLQMDTFVWNAAGWGTPQVQVLSDWLGRTITNVWLPQDRAYLTSQFTPTQIAALGLVYRRTASAAVRAQLDASMTPILQE